MSTQVVSVRIAFNAEIEVENVEDAQAAHDYVMGAFRVGAVDVNQLEPSGPIEFTIKDITETVEQEEE